MSRSIRWPFLILISGILAFSSLDSTASLGNFSYQTVTSNTDTASPGIVLQEEEEKNVLSPESRRFIEEQKKKNQDRRESATSPTEQVPLPAGESTELLKVYYDAKIAQYNNIIERYRLDTEKRVAHNLEYQHRLTVFRNQWWHSQIVFIIVIAIVVSGLILTFRQFNYTYSRYSDRHKLNQIRSDQTADPAGSDDDPTGNQGTKPATSVVKFGVDGIEITSSVVGLLVLIVSLAFFYLYLDIVFRITEVS